MWADKTPEEGLAEGEVTMRRSLLVIVVLVVLVGATWWSYSQLSPSRGGASSDVEGEHITVRRGTILATVEASGNVAPNRQVVLTFRTPGQVAAILVEEGQNVRAGDVLARLDTAELELAVRQAEVNVRAAEARLRQLRRPGTPAEVAAAEAALRSAQENLARVKAGPSPEEIAAARAQVEAAEAALQRLLAGPDEAQVAQAKATLAQAEAALRQAQAAYDAVAHRPDVAMLPQALQLEQATIEYERAKAAYEQALKGPSEEQIKQARAQVEQARATLKRLLESPTPADIAAAEAQVAQAEANLKRLTEGASPDEIAAQEAQVEQARLALEQARLNLQGAEIRAPFDGTVVALGAKEGEVVSAATPVVTLADLSRFELEVTVDEMDIALVEAGDPVTITLDAYRDTPMRGTVIYVAPVPAADRQGVVSFPVRIELDLATAPGPVRAGMTASAEIIVQQLDNVLIVPNRAISVDRTTGRLTVLKLEGGVPVPVEVATGLRGRAYTEIVAGLEEGDVVVIPAINRRERLRRELQGG